MQQGKPYAPIKDALTHYRAGDYDTTERICAAILLANPKSAMASYVLGLSFMRSGRADSGEAKIADALELLPEIGYFDTQRAVRQQMNKMDEVQISEARLHLYLESLQTNAFLISFPKSGRTWLRLLLGKYILGFEQESDPLDVRKLSYAAPNFATLDVSLDDYPQWKPYTQISDDKRAFASKKVLMLVRDPRDVLVSNFFHFLKRGHLNIPGFKFTGNLSEFIRQDIGGLKSIVAFYNVWARQRETPAAMEFVTYEELAATPVPTLARCIAFLGWPERPEGYLEQVVAYGSFENMRRMEEGNVFDNFRLAPPKNRDPEGFKVRRGVVGGYRDYLPKEDLAFIDSYIAQTLDPIYPYHPEQTAAANPG